MLEVSKQYFRSQGRKITQTDDMVRVVLDMSRIEYCNTIKKKNVAIKQEPTWISVNDRLPEESGYIMVINKDCFPFIGMFFKETGILASEDEYKLKYQLTHWIPLPEPPKEGE